LKFGERIITDMLNRFQAAAEALGFQKEQIKFIIVQLVRLVKDGKEAE
jgi:hypothetical protein